ncbi:MAG TPA: DUF99 family protein [Thermoplasmataceae archaeon]|nr:DUF99 family protein [Thermoplasmatales archaeon AK]HLH86030.1 DUF99 family protein [Thermoplasmataceae archaeon]
MFKRKARVIGIDDAPFKKGINMSTTLVMVLYRLDFIVEKVIAGKIEVDGSDATDAIIGMFRKLSISTAEAFITEGVTLGGFNIPSIRDIHAETGIPFISYVRRPPDIPAMEKALGKINNNVSLANLRSLKLEPVNIGNEVIYLNLEGIGKEEALSLLLASTRTGKTPEPVRLSHLIASGLANCY